VRELRVQRDHGGADADGAQGQGEQGVGGRVPEVRVQPEGAGYDDVPGVRDGESVQGREAGVRRGGRAGDRALGEREAGADVRGGAGGGVRVHRVEVRGPADRDDVVPGRADDPGADRGGGVLGVLSAVDRV